jgi:phage tail sheath protein FI
MVPQENVMRGRDFIHLSLMPALRTYLGRANITRQTVKAVLATIGGFLSSLQALEQILGYQVNFRGALNSAAEIRLGHLTVGFAAEEAPVLKRITTMSARYRPAIDQMVSQLEQELNTGIAA